MNWEEKLWKTMLSPLIKRHKIYQKKTDFLPQGPTLQLILLPLVARPPQRGMGLIPPLFPPFILIPSLLFLDFVCSSGKLQNISNNVIQIEQGRLFSIHRCSLSQPQRLPALHHLGLHTTPDLVGLRHGQAEKCCTCAQRGRAQDGPLALWGLSGVSLQLLASALCFLLLEM